MSEEDIYPTIEKAVRDVRTETPREPEGPAPSPEVVRNHRQRRQQKVTQAIERMGEHSYILHDAKRVQAEMLELHERLQEAEEVERIQDPVLRSVTRRVKAFKRGERKLSEHEDVSLMPDDDAHLEQRKLWLQMLIHDCLDYLDEEHETTLYKWDSTRRRFVVLDAEEQAFLVNNFVTELAREGAV